MGVVRVSYLKDLKSAFGSERDNFQFFKILKNSLGTQFNEVEFAQPKRVGEPGEIHWVSERHLDYRNYEQFSNSEQLLIARSLRDAFEMLSEKTASFQNAQEEFAKKLIEIPHLGSVYANPEDPRQVVLTEWGFFEDKFERKEGILADIFPPPDHPILVRLVDRLGAPMAQRQLTRLSDFPSIQAVTDQNGYARLDHLPRDFSFSIQGSLLELNPSNFTVDGRQEYLVEGSDINQVELTFRLRRSDGTPIPDFDLTFESKEGGKALKTNSAGECTCTTQVGSDTFSVLGEQKVLLTSALPGNDQTYEIVIHEEVIEEPRPDDEPPPTPPQSKPPYVQFVKGSSKKPVKGLDVKVTAGEGVDSVRLTTDQEGKIYPKHLSVSAPNELHFRHKGEEWVYPLTHKLQLEAHVVQLRPTYPWLWWLLLAVLVGLLFWCIFFHRCGMTYFGYGDQPPAQEVITAPPITCNSLTKSGGFGVTKTIVDLGPSSGIVHLTYDMRNVPDKLEVLDGNRLLVSTYDVPGNQNGFVGGNNEASCCSTLKFGYDANRMRQCTVVVTGIEDSTKWRFQIDCPV